MMEKKTRSFNFLLEMVVCLFFFTICALGSVLIFYQANALSDQAQDKTAANLLLVDTIEKLRIGAEVNDDESDAFTISVTQEQTITTSYSRYAKYNIVISDSNDHVLAHQSTII